MRTLLEYFVRYFDILYLDSRYRITDSSTTGVPTANASLRLQSPILCWNITNDRGQILLYVAPTELVTPTTWYSVSLIKQYLSGQQQIEYLSAVDEIGWVREDPSRLEQLFSDASTISDTCEKLNELRRLNSDKYWTTWREQQGLT
jgi:hypothetical protein